MFVVLVCSDGIEGHVIGWPCMCSSNPKNKKEKEEEERKKMKRIRTIKISVKMRRQNVFLFFMKWSKGI